MGPKLMRLCAMALLLALACTPVSEAQDPKITCDLVCPVVPPGLLILLPTLSCKYFCKCENVGGTPKTTLMECPPGTGFNPVLEVCDPALVPGCNN